MQHLPVLSPHLVGELMYRITVQDLPSMKLVGELNVHHDARPIYLPETGFTLWCVVYFLSMLTVQYGATTNINNGARTGLCSFKRYWGKKNVEARPCSSSHGVVAPLHFQMIGRDRLSQRRLQCSDKHSTSKQSPPLAINLQ